MKRPQSSAWIGSLVAALVAAGTGVSAQNNDLSAARDLYASAAYDEALTLLNRLRSSDHPSTDSRAIEQYRAFCLLALGRSADAEQAIEAVVAAEPTYHPGDSDVAPRVRAMFTDVRRRMLPTIIQQKYAVAKAAFDRKDFAEPTLGWFCKKTAPARIGGNAVLNTAHCGDLRAISNEDMIVETDACAKHDAVAHGCTAAYRYLCGYQTMTTNYNIVTNLN